MATRNHRGILRLSKPAEAPCGECQGGARPSYLPPLTRDAKDTLESGARLLDGGLRTNDFVSNQHRHHGGDDQEDGRASERECARAPKGYHPLHSLPAAYRQPSFHRSNQSS